MIYRPQERTRMWDSWLFEWEGTFHLFHLEAEHGIDYDQVGHAVSEDLVHWQSRSSISTRPPEDWNQWITLTGMVLHHRGKFYLFVGGYTYKGPKGEVEAVAVYTSDDLDHWQPHPDNPILHPGGPYVSDTADAPWHVVDWRDLFVTWREDDQCFHGLICARTPGWNHRDTGAVVGHLRSGDLLHWDYLPPLAEASFLGNMEVPELFELNGRYYVTFSTNSHGGIHIDTGRRQDVRGTFYMIGPSADGPFTLPDDPMLIGAAHRRLGAYAARSIAYRDGRILYHQVGDIGIERPAWGATKQIMANPDGSLWLKYLPILEKLETKTVLGPTAAPVSTPTNDLSCWQHKDGCWIGTAEAVGGSCTIVQEAGDLHLQCQIRGTSAACAGIVIRALDGKEGVGVLLDYEKQRLQLSPARTLNPVLGWTFTMQDSCVCALQREKEYHLRCFARAEYVEVFLDDRWVFTACISAAPGRGEVQLCVERGEAIFSDLRLAEVEPLA